MASTASSANVSMILTLPAESTDSRPGSGPRQPSLQGLKPCITGIASHLNHVPDTTCHIDRGAAGSGTAIANITTREGRHTPAPKAKARKLGIQRKHGFGIAGCETGHQAIE